MRGDYRIISVLEKLKMNVAVVKLSREPQCKEFSINRWQKQIEKLELKFE